MTGEVGDLKQGFSVNIEVKSKTKAILVPVSSLVMDDSKNYVWIVDEQQKAKKS